jgi:hypothetical protein
MIGDAGGQGGKSAESGKRRVVEYVCAQRGPITVVFFLSAMFLVASLFLLAFASLSPGSRAIAIADVGITGTICAVSGYVLRACNRRREGRD